MFMNAFFNSKVNYCPLILMRYNRSTNRKLNWLYERCLKYSQKNIALYPFTIDIFNIPPLKCIKSVTCYHHLSSAIFLNEKVNTDNLRFNSQFLRPLARSVFHGTENMICLSPVICDILPDSYKNLPNFRVFKNRIKKWKPENCPCRLCKTYISRIGLIQASTPVSWMKLWCF